MKIRHSVISGRDRGVGARRPSGGGPFRPAWRVDMSMQRVDAHCHFWDIARGDYGWLSPDVPALAPIYRNFAPADMARFAAIAGISRYVAVQAAPTEAETRYLLSLAANNPEIAGVVGWVDLSAADAPDRIANLAVDKKLKGVRPMLQDIAEDDWINSSPKPEALDALVRAGLRFDALVLPRHLAPLERFVRANPELPVIIDHAAKPALGEGPDDPRHAMWEHGMARLAKVPRVHCKLSGLLTEMRPDQCVTQGAALEVLRPVVDRLLDWFGPERLVWGSDWPVLTLAASHGDWMALARTLLSDLDADQQAAVFGGNAIRFYGLEEE